MLYGLSIMQGERRKGRKKKHTGNNSQLTRQLVLCLDKINRGPGNRKNLGHDNIAPPPTPLSWKQK